MGFFQVGNGLVELFSPLNCNGLGRDVTYLQELSKENKKRTQTQTAY